MPEPPPPPPRATPDLVSAEECRDRREARGDDRAAVHGHQHVAFADEAARVAGRAANQPRHAEARACRLAIFWFLQLNAQAHVRAVGRGRRCGCRPRRRAQQRRVDRRKGA